MTTLSSLPNSLKNHFTDSKSRRNLFRVLWVFILLLVVGILIAGIPFAYDISTTNDRSVAAQQLGIPINFTALFRIGIDIFVATVVITIASLLFWSNSAKPMVFITSATLLLSIVFFLYTSQVFIRLTGTQDTLLWQIIFTGIQKLTLLTFLVFLFTFPNGNYYWRWVPFFWVAFLIYLLTSPLNIRLTMSEMLATNFFMNAGILAQFYRYRYIYDAKARQQTKWAVIGFSGALIVAVCLLLQETIFNSWYDHLPITYTQFFTDHLVWFIRHFSLLLFPITILISSTRNRLWDADFVINRSIVYIGVTLGLAIVFAGIFFTLQLTLQQILDNNQSNIAIFIATAIVFTLFVPTRNYVRRTVDKYLYGIAVDYQAAIDEALSLEKIAEQIRATPTHFGEYTHIELLGRGGMGEVYRGKHPTLNYEVAIKLLPQAELATNRVKQRFKREAQTITHLAHPNIVKLYDFGEYEHTPYMVMEYVKGKNLKQLLQEKGKFTVEEVCQFLPALISAIHYTHEQGVVHRDLKPANIMMCAQNNSYRPVLMDFGIAKKIKQSTQLTQTGTMVGTLEYIPPEQLQGISTVDRRADIYALGAMTYQLLTGQVPFPRKNPGAMVMAHMLQPPPNAQELDPNIPSHLVQAIQKAMAKDPNDRFTDMNAFLNAISC